MSKHCSFLWRPLMFTIIKHSSATLQPIFHKRIGADTFVSRMARLREDARFRAVGPETLVVDVVLEDVNHAPGVVVGEDATDGEGEIWMDWAFVEFWKEHYCESRACPILVARVSGLHPVPAYKCTFLRCQIQSRSL